MTKGERQREKRENAAKVVGYESTSTGPSSHRQLYCALAAATSASSRSGTLRPGRDQGVREQLRLCGWDLSVQPSAGAAGAVHDEPSTERFNPVGESAQAAPFGHVGPAAAVVDYLDH
jgi:hypothetical protein